MRRAAFETALLVGAFPTLLFVLPHGLNGDDAVRFSDIEQLIHHGHLTSSQYSLVGPLFSAPFLLLGEIVGSPDWWAARFNLFVVAFGLVAAFALTRGRISPALFRTFALVLLLASFLTDRLRDYGAEVFTGTLVVLGTMAIVSGRYRRLGWAAFVIAVVNVPPAIVGLGFVAVAQAIRRRRLLPLLAPVAAVLLVMLEAWIRRGGPLTTGYAGNRGVATILPYSGKPGFSFPFVLGVFSILFSFGRGLLFFTPGLFTWLDGRTRRLAPHREFVVMLLLFVAGLVVIYAKWWAWYGGGSWGPRFFVVAAVPASLLLAVRLQDRAASTWATLTTLVVLVLSAWVGLVGALESGARSAFCLQGNYQTEFTCWYTPELSGLWWPVLHHPPFTTTTVILTTYIAVAFVYLAAPLVARLSRQMVDARPRELMHGWRF